MKRLILVLSFWTATLLGACGANPSTTSSLEQKSAAVVIVPPTIVANFHTSPTYAPFVTQVPYQTGQLVGDPETYGTRYPMSSSNTTYFANDPDFPNSTTRQIHVQSGGGPSDITCDLWVGMSTTQNSVIAPYFPASWRGNLPAGPNVIGVATKGSDPRTICSHPVVGNFYPRYVIATWLPVSTGYPNSSTQAMMLRIDADLAAYNLTDRFFLFQVK